jgi:integrase
LYTGFVYRILIPVMENESTVTKPDKTKGHLSKDGKWKSFPKAPGLLQYVSTGLYFARVKIDGKFFRKSLETNSLLTAKERLPDFIKEHKRKAAVEGTFGDALAKYRWEIDNDPALSPFTKKYRGACITKLLASWPGLANEPLKNLKAKECKAQFAQLWEKIDAQYFNNILGTFRAVLRKGGISPEDDPTKGDSPIKRKGVVTEAQELPVEVLGRLVDYLTKSSSWRHHKAAIVLRFLAFSGCRISEARQVQWSDVGESFIRIRNAKTRNHQNHDATREVPILPPMRELLAEMRRDNPKTTGPVLPFSECYGSVRTACAELKIESISHHTFRAWFATRAIEAGIDIPTVAQWCGHKDGGALLLKRYRKANQAHSLKMAERFTATGKVQQ